MPPASLDAGTRFGSYTVLRLLGEGGMGAVYEARHERLSKRVALKVLHANVVATNEEAVARFMREGEAASRIRHPNVVDVTDFGVEDGIPFMVMEFLEGESLGTVLESRGALEVSESVDLMLPIASALAAAHEEQIVHRDLKPDNIFLSRTRIGEVVPKLVDFGISKLESEHDPRLTAADAMIGTPQYMSPEQARGSRSVDARTDQYAFGVILFECVTGQTAVQGDSLLEILHEIHSGRISQLDALRPGVPAGLVDAVARMHARDPAERYPDMLAAGAALLPFASPREREVWGARFVMGGAAPASIPSGSGPVEKTPAPTSRSASSTLPFFVYRSSRLVGLAAAAVLVLGALVAALALRPGPETSSAPAPLMPSPAVAGPSPPAVPRGAAPTPPAVPRGAAPTMEVRPAFALADDGGATRDAPAGEVAAAPGDAGPAAAERGDGGPLEADAASVPVPVGASSARPAAERAPGATPRRPRVKRGANQSIILR